MQCLCDVVRCCRGCEWTISSWKLWCNPEAPASLGVSEDGGPCFLWSRRFVIFALKCLCMPSSSTAASLTSRGCLPWHYLPLEFREPIALTCNIQMKSLKFKPSPFQGQSRLTSAWHATRQWNVNMAAKVTGTWFSIGSSHRHMGNLLMGWVLPLLKMAS